MFHNLNIKRQSVSGNVRRVQGMDHPWEGILHMVFLIEHRFSRKLRLNSEISVPFKIFSVNTIPKYKIQ